MIVQVPTRGILNYEEDKAFFVISHASNQEGCDTITYQKRQRFYSLQSPPNASLSNLISYKEVNFIPVSVELCSL